MESPGKSIIAKMIVDEETDEKRMQKDAKMIPENNSDSEKGSANVNPRLIFIICTLF